MRNCWVLLSAAVLLGGCWTEQSASYETGVGGEGTYTIEADYGETNISATAAGGDQMGVRAGPQVEVELPAGFDIYPGARIVSSAEMDANGENGRMVVMTTSATPPEVVEYYRAKAGEAGMPVQSETNIGGTMMISGGAESGTSFDITASETRGATTVNLLFGEGQGG